MPQKVMSTVLGTAGALTLGLAMMGLYGVMAFMVAQRRREVGIRIAVGADPRRVVVMVVMVVREGMMIAGVGVAAGLVLVVVLGRLAASLLYGVGAVDPLSLAGGVVLLLTATVLATLPAAVRAARVNPVQCLRAG